MSNNPNNNDNNSDLNNKKLFASHHHHHHHGRLSGLSRAEKSLTALTTKFMTLLQESPNGVLDLRSVYVFYFIFPLLIDN